jgi:hypothetical protein
MTGSAEPAPPTEEPRRPAAAGRLPDFFLVGHSKSGTTALYEMLGRHPQIFLPEMKEPIFFAPELPRRTQRYRAPGALEEYVALFAAARPEQLVGEGSASYLRSPNAARLIAQARPDARIVAILREPASFLRSFHLQVVQSHYEDERDLARALSLEGERRRGRYLPRRSLWPQELLYLDHVRYLEQLRRFEVLFGADQLLVLIYDDFRAENAATISRVLRLLGVDENVELGAAEANPTTATRSQRADEALHALSHGEGRVGGAVRRASALVPRRLRRAALGTAQRRLVSAAAPEPDERVMRTLRRRFRPEVEALSDHLGRDLVALWRYDEPA